jgi:hypothetical protein
MFSRILAVALPLLVIAGCHSASSLQTGELPAEFRDAGMPGVAEMQKRCLEQVPPGTTVEKAEEVMSANGFKIAKKSDETGAYLDCDLGYGGEYFGTKRWRVKIRHTDGVVDDVVVSAGADQS